LGSHRQSEGYEEHCAPTNEAQLGSIPVRTGLRRHEARGMSAMRAIATELVPGNEPPRSARIGLSMLKLRAEIFTGPAMSGRTNWEM
jgi:hypothetical protein